MDESKLPEIVRAIESRQQNPLLHDEYHEYSSHQAKRGGQNIRLVVLPNDQE